MISVIIIVKYDKRIAKLLKALKGIEKPQKVEIIVVDASQGILTNIKKKNSHAKWVTFKSSDPTKTTIPEQRNVGVKHAKGNIIAFIDSDCIPHKKWLVELIEPIKKEKENIVAGHVEHSNKNSTHALEFAKNLGKIYIDEAPTMNLAIKRSLFRELGCFDEKFQCGEDVDFLWRAVRKGYRIRYAMNAYVTHDLGGMHNELRRMFVYGTARVHLYTKHKYKQRMFWRNEVFKVIYPLYIICLPLTYFFYYYPLLGILLIYMNRKSKPFNQILMKTIYGAGILRELFFRKYKKYSKYYF